MNKQITINLDDLLKKHATHGESEVVKTVVERYLKSATPSETETAIDWQGVKLVIGETEASYCPLIRATCKGERCAWVRGSGNDARVCAIPDIADLIQFQI